MPNHIERSVLALFMPNEDDRDDRPARAGSCVLARLHRHPFLVTAGHTIRDVMIRSDAGNRTLHFAPRGHTLRALTNARCYWYEPERGGLDMGLIPIAAHQLPVFDELEFLPTADIDIEVDRQPLSPHDRFVVCGWPQSKSRFQVDRPRLNIEQAPFTFSTVIARTRFAGCERFTPESYLVLAFDPEQITVTDVPRRPPDPTGISGGAAFRDTNGTLTLAGIVTEHREQARVMIATRVTEFIRFAHDVIDMERSPSG